jgi:hypothetical protein
MFPPLGVGPRCCCAGWPTCRSPPRSAWRRTCAARACASRCSPTTSRWASNSATRTRSGRRSRRSSAHEHLRQLAHVAAEVELGEVVRVVEVLVHHRHRAHARLALAEGRRRARRRRFPAACRLSMLETTCMLFFTRWWISRSSVSFSARELRIESRARSSSVTLKKAPLIATGLPVSSRSTVPRATTCTSPPARVTMRQRSVQRAAVGEASPQRFADLRTIAGLHEVEQELPPADGFRRREPEHRAGCWGPTCHVRRRRGSPTVRHRMPSSRGAAAPASGGSACWLRWASADWNRRRVSSSAVPGRARARLVNGTIANSVAIDATAVTSFIVPEKR